jgi:hypothetical protein
MLGEAKEIEEGWGVFFFSKTTSLFKSIVALSASLDDTETPTRIPCRIEHRRAVHSLPRRQPIDRLFSHKDQRNRSYARSCNRCVAWRSAIVIILSSPKNSNRHPILLFQSSHLQAIRLPYPTVPRPTTLRLVSRETAISVASPEVERSAQFDAVCETVHERL